MPGTGAQIAALLPSWELSLTERDLSPKTIEVYMRTGEQFTRWLLASGLPADTEGVDAPHIRAFLAAETARTSAVSSHQHFRNLRVLFKWLAREDERTGPNPMERVDEPKVTRRIKPVLAEFQLAALLRGCEGSTFESRRDMAIIRVFIDSGVRVSGLANVRKDAVMLTAKTVKVVLKGGDEHLVPVGRKAAAALDRYIRARARHRHAGSPWLWLGTAGRDPGHFGTAGIQDMLERRGRAAGIENLTPHFFRRTFAHDWLDSGGSELDGMRIAGWKTRAMIEQYAGELAGERARQAHARLAPGDRI
jgi:site-specific recombinase XerD